MRTKLTIVFAALLMASVTLWAQGPRARGHRGGGHGALGFGAPLGRVAVVLDMTDAQQEQAKAILEEARGKSQPIRQEMKQAREEMQSAVQAGDEFSIDSLAARQGEQMAQLISLGAKTKLQLRQILNEDQKAKLDALRETRMERWKSRRGHHRPPSEPEPSSEGI